MKTVSFEYKCRRCGATVLIRMNDRSAESPYAALSFRIQKPLDLIIMHDCRTDKGRGICDLIGHSPPVELP